MKTLYPGIGMTMLLSSLIWTSPVMAYDYSVSGESSMILRMRTSVDDKRLLPAYEYLRLAMTDNRSDGSGVSFQLGAWGRGDLADKTTAANPDGDLQYAYLTYRAPHNNTAVTVGRQFITEGVASERIDGLSLRNDFDYGLGASAFFGNSVLTGSTGSGTPVIYGSRISRTDRKYYTVGLSALKSERDDNSSYREEEGVDLWLRPFAQVDVTGRSTYNSITKGWMEHSYAVAYTPFSTLTLAADASHVNFHDYLFNMTTSALSMLNPVWKENEQQTAFGTSASYSGITNLTVAADYKFFRYDQSGNAALFGGKASYSFPGALVAGAALHRMAGETDRLRYVEWRAFITKIIGPADLTIDSTTVNYDREINGIRNSYTVTGAAGYNVSRKLKVGTDIEFSRNPDFNSEVRGLVKAIYSFDTKFAAEGGTKSEK